MLTAGLLGGISWESSAHHYRLLNERVIDLGADGIVLGCTEIELLIEQTDRPVLATP